MNHSEEVSAIIGYEDARAFLTLRDKGTASVLDASSPIALFGIASEAAATDGFDESLALSVLNSALGRMPTEDDFDHPWDDTLAAALSFVGESGTEHTVSVSAFHLEDESMTLAEAADVLLAILSANALATILDRIKASGDLTAAEIESELGGRLIGGQS